MTGFLALPEDIKSLGKLVGTQADHAAACQRYILNNTGLQGGEGWLNDLSGAHEALVGNTADWFSTLSRYTLEAAEFSITDSADYYAKTDADSAAKLDSQLEGYQTSPPEGHEYHYERIEIVVGTFGEKYDPESYLTEPDDYAAQGAWRWEPSWSDYASISSAGRGAIMAATEGLSWLGLLDRSYDPYEFLLKPVTGDWAGFRACADVYRNTANACRSIEFNINHGRIGLPSAWSGRAADSCEHFLAAVCAALPGAADVLDDIAEEYEDAAKGALEFSSVVGSLISSLVDAAVICAAALGGGAASASTIIGPIIGGGVALYEGKKIADMINSLVDVYNTTKDIMAAVEAGMNSFGQLQASDKSLPKAPEAGDADSSMGQLPG
ncbi:hypothetical protein [Glycomyces tenuis]|uniref:hypothetical protein n=1 Tax=Glycomyces tenuis TaxID=58116 RepID=UPI0003F6CE2D|nr:hypothetical protein [Glycomyces tenuis]